MSLEFVPEKPFSEYLSEERKKKNLSVRVLSKRSGVSQACILRYENGTSQPDIVNAVNLAYALGVSLKEFIFHIEEADDLLVCYDLDDNEQFLIQYNNLYDLEKENHFCVVYEKKLYLFKNEPFDECLGYLLKKPDEMNFRISYTEEDGFEVIGYLIREIL